MNYKNIISILLILVVFILVIGCSYRESTPNAFVVATNTDSPPIKSETLNSNVYEQQTQNIVANKDMDDVNERLDVMEKEINDLKIDILKLKDNIRQEFIILHGIDSQQNFINISVEDKMKTDDSKVSDINTRLIDLNNRFGDLGSLNSKNTMDINTVNTQRLNDLRMIADLQSKVGNIDARIQTLDGTNQILYDLQKRVMVLENKVK